jgi:hypothetical protein
VGSGFGHGARSRFTRPLAWRCGRSSSVIPPCEVSPTVGRRVLGSHGCGALSPRRYPGYMAWVVVCQGDSRGLAAPGTRSGALADKRSRHCCPSIPCPFLVAPDPSPTVEGQCLVGGDGRRPSAVGPSRSPRPGGRIGDDGGAAAGTDAGGRTVGRSGRMPPAWRGLDGRAEIDRRVRHPPIVGSGPAGRRKAGRCRGAPLRPRGAGTPAKRG